MRRCCITFTEWSAKRKPCFVLENGVNPRVKRTNDGDEYSRVRLRFSRFYMNLYLSRFAIGFLHGTNFFYGFKVVWFLTTTVTNLKIVLSVFDIIIVICKRYWATLPTTVWSIYYKNEIKWLNDRLRFSKTDYK